MNYFSNLRRTLEEKTLTSAEKKKREEVAQAIEREHPGMPKSKKMAIATSTAIKAEEVEQTDEARHSDPGKRVLRDVEAMERRNKPSMAALDKNKMISASDKDKLAKTAELMKREREMKEEVEQVDEISNKLVAKAAAMRASQAEDKPEDTKLAAKAKNLENAVRTRPGNIRAFHDAKMQVALNKNLAKVRKEEVEQVDELKKSTMANYMNKAVDPDLGIPRGGKDKLKKRLEGLARAKKKLREETDLDEASDMHRVNITVSNPNDPMVTKRKETIQKTVRVKALDKENALHKAKQHYKDRGYKVHDAEHIGMVNEAEKVAKHRPGWMLRADKKLGDAAKEGKKMNQLMAKYGGKPEAGKPVKEEKEPTHAVTLTRGSVVGARSHKMFDVVADDEDHAVRVAKKQFKEKFPNEKHSQYRVSHVHAYKNYQNEEAVAEGIEDRIEAARKKAAAAGKPINPPKKEVSPRRQVSGSSYGGSKQKEKEEMDEASLIGAHSSPDFKPWKSSKTKKWKVTHSVTGKARGEWDEPVGALKHFKSLAPELQKVHKIVKEEVKKNVPFEGPYKDKPDAHGPRARVKHLAKMAMAAAAAKAKEAKKK